MSPITLESIRAGNAARQRVFYAKNRVRILSEKKIGRDCVKAQKTAAAAPAEPAAAPAHDPEEEPPAPAANKSKIRVKYGLIAALAAAALITHQKNGALRAPATLSATQYGIKGLFKFLGNPDDLYTKLKPVEQVVKKLTTAADSGVKNQSISTIIARTKCILLIGEHLPKFGLSDAAMNSYREAYALFVSQSREKVKIAKSGESHKVYLYPAYKRKIEAHFGADSLENLLANLYEIVPVRDDFAKLYIVEKASDIKNNNDNCLILSRTKATIRLRNFKTDAKFVSLKLPDYILSAPVATLLRAYIIRHNRPYGEVLFPKHKSGLTSVITAMNKAVGILEGGVSALRSIKIMTEIDKNKHLSATERKKREIKLASLMLHSPDSAAIYHRAVFDDDVGGV